MRPSNHGFPQRGYGWTGSRLSVGFPEGLSSIRRVLGSVGDLCRATSGERETEPKQIGDGTQDTTERVAYTET